MPKAVSDCPWPSTQLIAVFTWHVAVARRLKITCLYFFFSPRHGPPNLSGSDERVTVAVAAGGAHCRTACVPVTFEFDFAVTPTRYQKRKQFSIIVYLQSLSFSFLSTYTSFGQLASNDKCNLPVNWQNRHFIHSGPEIKYASFSQQHHLNTWFSFKVKSNLTTDHIWSFKNLFNFTLSYMALGEVLSKS